MPKLPQLKYSQFTKKLRKSGFSFYRQAKGSHEIWFNTVTKRFVSVPRHPGTFKKGTLGGMIEDMGVSLEDFLRL